MGILKSTVSGIFNSAKAISTGTVDGLNKILEGVVDGYEEIKFIPSSIKLDRRKQLSGIYEVQFEPGTVLVRYDGRDNSWEMLELSWDLEEEAREMGWTEEEARNRKFMTRQKIDHYFIDLCDKNNCAVRGPHFYPRSEWD